MYVCMYLLNFNLKKNRKTIIKKFKLKVQVSSKSSSRSTSNAIDLFRRVVRHPNQQGTVNAKTV